MKIRGRKGTKVLALLLCQCMAIGMFSMRVCAENIPDNGVGGTVAVAKAEVMKNNYGTIKINEGTVENNYGTVENNYGTVTSNINEVTTNFGTVDDNVGQMLNNYGTVIKPNDRIIYEYRKFTINGENADKVSITGDVSNPNEFWYVRIHSTSNTIILSPTSGYHFESAPTANPGTIIQSGSNYEISNIPDDSEPLVITLNIVKDSDPTPDDNNDNHHDTTKTVEKLNPYVVFLQTQTTKVTNAKTGETVLIESDSYQSYPTAFMKTLLERRDITVKMSYNYKGMHYEVVIPQNYKFVPDEKIPWYGPLKLAEMFGAVITPIEK